MSITRRHHFIPVFYLKNFTDNDGLFYIFDKGKQTFKNKGKKFAPKSHFFEFEGNTTYYNLEPSDFIEKSFSNWDSKVADVYRKIINAKNGAYNLNPHEWTLLQYFINILYWRNPSNEHMVKEYIAKAKSISDFKMKLIRKHSNKRASINEEIDLLNKIKQDADFPKFLKSMLPAITYSEIFKKKENDFAHIFSFPLGLPKVVSDNPIIYRNLENETLHTDDFIFPLSPTQLLIRNKLSGLVIHGAVRILIDMMLFMQAKQYLSCTDLKYPLILQEQFSKSFSSIEDLRKAIFRNIYLKTGQ
jgi:hypothetical protein